MSAAAVVGRAGRQRSFAFDRSHRRPLFVERTSWLCSSLSVLAIPNTETHAAERCNAARDDGPERIPVLVVRRTAVDEQATVYLCANDESTRLAASRIWKKLGPEPPRIACAAAGGFRCGDIAIKNFDPRPAINTPVAEQRRPR